MPIQAGLLDRRVRIEKRLERTDDDGQVRFDWVPVATVRARVQPLRAGERFGDHQVVATGDVRLTIRWRAGVTPLERFVLLDGGEESAYDILSAVCPDRRVSLEIVGRARTEARP